jgi:hypothetical protein
MSVSSDLFRVRGEEDANPADGWFRVVHRDATIDAVRCDRVHALVVPRGLATHVFDDGPAS